MLPTASAVFESSGLHFEISNPLHIVIKFDFGSGFGNYDHQYAQDFPCYFGAAVMARTVTLKTRHHLKKRP
jgi:hypothetical protein